MANFLFFSVPILSYLIFKFLRRFTYVIFENYPLNDARESFTVPANSISAGQNVLLKSKLPQPTFEVPEKSPVFLPSKRLQTDEESDLIRKEKLYISALNQGRPRKRQKIRKLPVVGNLPTIIESLPYPITRDALMSLLSKEEPVVENTNEVEDVSVPIQKNNSFTEGMENKGEDTVAFVDKSFESIKVQAVIENQIAENFCTSEVKISSDDDNNKEINIDNLKCEKSSEKKLERKTVKCLDSVVHAKKKRKLCERVAGWFRKKWTKCVCSCCCSSASGE